MLDFTIYLYSALSFYCVLDKIYFALCLTSSSIFLDYKTILKLYHKTTFNSVFVDKQIIITEQKITSGKLFS
jgi:hypothetical protein